MKRRELSIGPDAQKSEFDNLKVVAGDDVLMLRDGKWDVAKVIDDGSGQIKRMNGNKMEMNVERTVSGATLAGWQEVKVAPIVLKRIGSKIDFDGKEYVITQRKYDIDGHVFYDLEEIKARGAELTLLENGREVTYIVDQRRVDASGNITYDLKITKVVDKPGATGVAPTVGYIDSGRTPDTVDKTLKQLKNITIDNNSGDFAILQEAKTKIVAEVERLVEKVKKVSGEKREQIMKKLTELETVLIKSTNGLSSPEKLTGLLKSVKGLQKEMALATAALEKEIGEAINLEAEIVGKKSRFDMAQSLTDKFQDLVDADDALIKAAYDVALQEHEDIVLDEKDLLEKKKINDDTLKKTKPNDPNYAALKIQEVNIQADLAAIKKKVNYKKPELKLISTSDNLKDDKWKEIWDDLVTRVTNGVGTAANECTSDEKKLHDEIISLVAKRSGKQKDKAIIQLLKQKLTESMAIAATERAEFDFDKEQAGLMAEWQKLMDRVVAGGFGDLKKELETFRDTQVLAVGTAPVTIYKLSDLSTHKNDNNIKDVLIDIRRVLGKVEVKIFEKENSANKTDFIKIMDSQERNDAVVELPPGLIKELFNGNEAGMRATMEKALDAAIDEKGVSSDLENAVENLINSINLTPAQTEKLAKYGIRDWNKYKKRFLGEMKKTFAGQLMEMSNSELKSYLTEEIVKIRGDRGLWENFKARYQTSALGQMKGAVAVRTLVNMVALGGTGLAIGLLTSPLSAVGAGSVRAGIIGTAVGTMKVGMQRLLGWKKLGIEADQMRAQKDAETSKKKEIKIMLMKNMLTKPPTVAGGASTFEISGTLLSMLSSAFKESSREVAEEKEKKITIGDGANQIVLEGDAQLKYVRWLEQAANEGQEVNEKIKLEFAKAIYAIHHNRNFDFDKAPLSVRSLKWFSDSYSGRVAQVDGHRRTVGVATGTGSGDNVGITRQLLVTGGLGASVAVSVGMTNSFLVAGLGTGTIGGVMGYAMGERAQHEKNRNQADRESRGALEKINTEIHRIVESDTNDPSELEKLQVYFDVMSAVLVGGKISSFAEEKLASMTDHKFLLTNQADLASFVQRNKAFKGVAEVALEEIDRSRLLKRFGFMKALRQLQETGRYLGSQDAEVKQAENAKSVTRARMWARIGRGAGYAIGYGGASYLIGAGIKAFHNAHSPEAHMAAVRENGDNIIEVNSDAEREALEKNLGVGVLATKTAAGTSGGVSPVHNTEHVQSPENRVGEEAVRETRNELEPAGKKPDQVLGAPETVAPKGQMYEITTIKVSKGGSALGAMDKLRVSGGRDVLAEAAKSDVPEVAKTQLAELMKNKHAFHAWEYQQLEKMGYKWVDGKLGHPINIHPGAQLHVYWDQNGQGGQGEWRANFDAEHVTVNKTLHFLEAKPGTPVVAVDQELQARMVKANHDTTALIDDLSKNKTTIERVDGELKINTGSRPGILVDKSLVSELPQKSPGVPQSIVGAEGVFDNHAAVLKFENGVRVPVSVDLHDGIYTVLPVDKGVVGEAFNAKYHEVSPVSPAGSHFVPSEHRAEVHLFEQTKPTEVKLATNTPTNELQTKTQPTTDTKSPVVETAKSEKQIGSNDLQNSDEVSNPQFISEYKDAISGAVDYWREHLKLFVPNNTNIDLQNSILNKINLSRPFLQTPTAEELKMIAALHGKSLNIKDGIMLDLVDRLDGPHFTPGEKMLMGMAYNPDQWGDPMAHTPGPENTRASLWFGEGEAKNILVIKQGDLRTSLVSNQYSFDKNDAGELLAIPKTGEPFRATIMMNQETGELTVEKVSDIQS